MNYLIEIRDLEVHRAGRRVLEIEALKIEKGKVLALVGPNGAGKTTLLLVLARLLKPGHGEILFAGQPIEHIQARDYRRRIGLVMQEALLLGYVRRAKYRHRFALSRPAASRDCSPCGRVAGTLAYQPLARSLCQATIRGRGATCRAGARLCASA